MTMPAVSESEDMMTLLAYVILVSMFMVTAVSASLWFCNCCAKRTKAPRSRNNLYSLSPRGGSEFDNPQGSYIRNALTAQLSPTIRVTPGSHGTLTRSPSFEVCSKDAFAVSPGVDIDVPMPAKPSRAAAMLASLARRLASLRRNTSPVVDAVSETSEDRELGTSSMDGMLRKFDSLLLSVQWSDLTEPEPNPPEDIGSTTVIELVNQASPSPPRPKDRLSRKLVLHTAVGDSCPALKSPDVFSFKSLGSDQSFYSIDDFDRQTLGDSTCELYRSCSYDGIPQSCRRSSCL